MAPAFNHQSSAPLIEDHGVNVDADIYYGGGEAYRSRTYSHVSFSPA
jgi:hypothetical protein